MANDPNFKQMQKDRVKRLQDVMKEQGFAGLFLGEGANVRYVTNVKLPGGSVFVPRDGEPILYSRSRDWGYVERDYPNLRPALHSSNVTGEDLPGKAARWAKDIKETMKEFGVEGERLGVDPLDVVSIHALAELGIDVVDGRHALSVSKRIKTDDEVNCFRTMGHWYQDIMERFRQEIRPGIRETELTALVHYEAIRKGAEEIFQLNVCSGENMNPWRRWPTEREVKQEEFVGIDLHLVGLGGCWTDVSRTYYCGNNPTQEQRDLYRTAYDYLQGVIALLKPGERIDHVVANVDLGEMDSWVQFFADTLGFTILRTDPPDEPVFAIAHLGEAVVMFMSDRFYAGARSDLDYRGAGVDIRLKVPDVDAVYERIRAAGLEVLHPIGDRDYGLRDFIMRDPFGFRLRFASALT